MTNLILNAGLILGQAAPAETAAAPSFPWPMIIIMFVLMYFLLLRPQQKKAKEAEALIKSAKTGDQVVAAGGIMGMISNVKDTTVILKVADNVKIEVLKTSIVSVTKSAPETTTASS